MTNEEMRTAVLAECERLCPHSNDERIGLSSLDTHYILPIEDGWWLIRVGATKCTIGPDCDLDAMNWLCAYRLLGLESKAKDAEIDGLLGMVKREQEIADEYLGRLKVEREKIAWLRAGIGAVLKLRGSAFSFEKTYGFSMLSYLLTGEEYKDQCKRLVEDELENGGFDLEAYKAQFPLDWRELLPNCDPYSKGYEAVRQKTEDQIREMARVTGLTFEECAMQIAKVIKPFSSPNPSDKN